MSIKSTRKGKIVQKIQALETVVPVLDEVITALETRLTQVEVKLHEILTKNAKQNS